MQQLVTSEHRILIKLLLEYSKGKDMIYEHIHELEALSNKSILLQVRFLLPLNHSSKNYKYIHINAYRNQAIAFYNIRNEEPTTYLAILNR